MALNNIAAAIDSLGPHGTAVRPVFVDLDPAKTTRPQLTSYLRSYGQRFVGLTGTLHQLQTAASSFGVTAQKQQFSADPMDYAMTHTSPIILWDLRTGTRTTLPANCPTACIIDAVERATTTQAFR
jgi:protein SCO1/2